MDHRTQRPERTGLLTIILIGATLATALAGGMHLLGRTDQAWRARYERPTPQPPSPTPTASEITAAETKLREQHELVVRQRQAIERGDLRCIDGQLFRRLPNGWENLPGQTCQ